MRVRILVQSAGVLLLAMAGLWPGRADDSPAGTWKGVYFDWPKIIGLDVNVQPAASGTGFEGEMHIHQIDMRRGPSPGLEGTAKINVQYDPVAHTFLFDPTAWIVPSREERADQIAGVINDAQDELAGTRAAVNLTPNSCPYVFFARGPNADALLQHFLTACAGGMKSGGPSPNWSAAFPAWLNRLEEKPGFDPNSGLDFESNCNLLADVDFQPSFGKNFDDLTVAERRDFYRLIPQTIRLKNMLATSQSPGVVLAVVYQRILRPWIDRNMAPLDTLPATDDSFAQIDNIEALVMPKAAPLRPSDIAHLKEKFASARARLALPIVTAAADQLLSTATGAKGARDAALFVVKNDAQVKFLTTDDQAKLKARMDDATEKLLAPALSQEAATAASSGQGIAAVATGVQWYRHLHGDYSFAANTVCVKDALASLTARRAADLASAVPAIIGKIQQQPSDAAISGTLDTYLGVPGDRDTPAGQQILAAVPAKHLELEHQAWLALFSARERSLMGPGGTLAVPAGYGPPSEEELRLGTLRTFADAFPSSKILTPFQVRVSSVMGILFRTESTITLKDVTMISPPKRDPAGGYDCSFSVEEAIESANAVATVNIPYVHGTYTQRFELGPNGWWSPTLRDKALRGQDDDTASQGGALFGQ